MACFDSELLNLLIILLYGSFIYVFGSFSCAQDAWGGVSVFVFVQLSVVLAGAWPPVHPVASDVCSFAAQLHKFVFSRASSAHTQVPNDDLGGVPPARGGV